MAPYADGPVSELVQGWRSCTRTWWSRSSGGCSSTTASRRRDVSRAEAPRPPPVPQLPAADRARMPRGQLQRAARCCLAAAVHHSRVWADLSAAQTAVRSRATSCACSLTAGLVASLGACTATCLQRIANDLSEACWLRASAVSSGMTATVSVSSRSQCAAGSSLSLGRRLQHNQPAGSKYTYIRQWAPTENPQMNYI